jgi:hypothetical protein
VDLLLRLFGIAATAVFVLSVVVMLLTFRRARRLNTSTLVVPALLSLAILVLYGLLLRAMPSAGWMVASLVAGTAIGAVWARTQALFRARDGAIRSRGSLWYLAVWAAVLTLNQLVMLVAGRSSPALMGLLVFSTGVAIGNGLVLLRRVRRLRAAVALAMVLVAPAAVADAEEVLLLLPSQFDVRPISGSSRMGGEMRTLTAKDLEGDPNPFRFRGEDVTQEMSRTDHHAFPECTVDIQYHHEYRATFRRGVLNGRWLAHQRNYYRNCKDRDDGEYMRVNHEGVISGQADADGRLKVTVQTTNSEIIDRRIEWVGKGNEGRFVSFNEWKKRDQAMEPWSFGLGFQLPVGELQSSQKLSPRPTPAPLPRAGTASAGGDRSEPRPGALGGEASGGRDESRSGIGVRAGTRDQARDASRDEVRDEPPAGNRDEPVDGPPPVSPAAAAGAAAGTAALTLLGAAWMLASSGVRPGDLLGSPAPGGGEPFEPPPTPRDGDVRPESGEVWSDSDRGWVSPNLYELERGQWRADVERAQAVSREESRGDGTDIDHTLRDSEARQRAAASAQAEAARVFDLEASFQPEKIEPYRPTWTDRVGSGLEYGEYWADTGVSVLAEVTGPAGQELGRFYTVTKETVKGASEGVAAYVRGQGGALAAEGSAWVIVERTGIGFVKGGAKVGLDFAAGEVIGRAAARDGLPFPELPDMSKATMTRVFRDAATGAAEGQTRRVVGIAVGKTLNSQALQKPAGLAVEATTGERL